MIDIDIPVFNILQVKCKSDDDMFDIGLKICVLSIYLLCRLINDKTRQYHVLISHIKSLQDINILVSILLRARKARFRDDISGSVENIHVDFYLLAVILGG